MFEYVCIFVFASGYSKLAAMENANALLMAGLSVLMWVGPPFVGIPWMGGFVGQIALFIFWAIWKFFKEK